MSAIDDRNTSTGPNDVLRLGLELAALAALGWWGWTGTAGPGRYAMAVGLPLVVAVLWGTFRVPGDPGDAPIAVTGPVRLGFEVAAFGIASAALMDAVGPVVGLGFAIAVATHYLLAMDRVRGLVADRWPP